MPILSCRKMEGNKASVFGFSSSLSFFWHANQDFMLFSRRFLFYCLSVPLSLFPKGSLSSLTPIGVTGKETGEELSCQLLTVPLPCSPSAEAFLWVQFKHRVPGELNFQLPHGERWLTFWPVLSSSASLCLASGSGLDLALHGQIH